MVKMKEGIRNMFPNPYSFNEIYMETCTAIELRDLIMKYSSCEARLRKFGRSYLWKTRRRKAVSIFEKHFGLVPSTLKEHSLPNPFGLMLFDQDVKKWYLAYKKFKNENAAGGSDASMTRPF